jgi:hypothetical protein
VSYKPYKVHLVGEPKTRHVVRIGARAGWEAGQEAAADLSAELVARDHMPELPQPLSRRADDPRREDMVMTLRLNFFRRLGLLFTGRLELSRADLLELFT